MYSIPMLYVVTRLLPFLIGGCILNMDNQPDYHQKPALSHIETEMDERLRLSNRTRYVKDRRGP